MNLQAFSGRSNLPLAQRVCDILGVPLGPMDYKVFADGELRPRFCENIRGSDVYIVQSTNQPHENLVELLLMLRAAKRASAGRITAVIPYFGYARQDQKDRPRVPVSAKLFADLIGVAGARRVI